jgi:hypothetical protein
MSAQNLAEISDFTVIIYRQGKKLLYNDSLNIHQVLVWWKLWWEINATI